MHIIETARAGVITDAPTFSHIGTNILFFLLSVVGIIAIIALVIAALMYLSAAGDEKQMEVAKIYVQYSILGIIMAMGGMVAIGLIGQFFKG